MRLCHMVNSGWGQIVAEYRNSNNNTFNPAFFLQDRLSIITAAAIVLINAQ